MNATQVVFRFEGGVPPGQWTFPFSVELPKWAPGSFFFCGFRESKLELNYKLMAQIAGNDGNYVEGKRRLIVRKPPLEIATGQNLTSTQKLVTCCCVDQGTANIACNFEKNAYTPYEVAKCYMEASNKDCKIPVDSITFTLKRKVWAKAGFHQLRVPETTLATLTLPGLLEGQERPKEHMELDLNTARESNRFMISKTRGAGKAEYAEEDLAIQKEPLQPSVTGTILSCHYVLEAKMNYGCCDCCRSTPTCRLPMTIYSADIQPDIPPPPMP